MNEFERKAWDSREGSTSHPPKRALDACLDDIAKGVIKPIQVCIVVTQRHDDGDVSVSTYQAGEYDTHGIVGTLFKAQHILTRGE